MKSYIIHTMFFILTVGFISCGQNVEKAEKKFLTNAVDQLKIDGEYEWIVVLPGLGCHGCIQEGEFFMKENISNKKILFVLTNIVSLKILQQKMDITIGDNPNIYVDRSNQFKLTTDNSIYPCIIRLKSGKIEQFEFQSPQNAAFHKMKKQLE